MDTATILVALDIEAAASTCTDHGRPIRLCIACNIATSTGTPTVIAA
ncbi:hypothetical protein HS041_22510 [Planomonospora sp. ID67723]|nr:hypothetical protein [Planomonospora sp. ID67723]MBG0830538.1 hypothetical protein [Planomonospora sp. ID67723]